MITQKWGDFMEHRFTKPVAMLGVTLFATSVFATSFQATHQVNAHAMSVAEVPLTNDENAAFKEYEYKIQAFQDGYENRTDSSILNFLAHTNTAKYYDAGKATSLGVFYALTDQTPKDSDTNKDIINEATAAAKQGVSDYENHSISEGAYVNGTTDGSPKKIYEAEKQNVAPATNKYGQISFAHDINNFGYDDTTDIVNHFAYKYAIQAVAKSPLVNYESAGYQYGYQAALNGGPYYQYGYTANRFDDDEFYYIQGYRDTSEAKDAVNDIRNNARSYAGIINKQAYIASYVGYQMGKYNYGFDNNLDFATNAQKYQWMTKAYKYGYDAGVKDRPTPTQVVNEPVVTQTYYSSNNSNTTTSNPVVHTTTIAKPTTHHKKVTKKHVAKKHVVKKHHKKVVKKHVRKHVKKAKVLFKVKVKAHKLYAYKSTNFKHHFGRKVERKNTKLKVYGIVRKHHKTYYRVYGHRLILANKHTVTKVR